METVATRLDYAMRIRGLKQIDLCNLTGLSKPQISCYLSGKYSPRMDAILLLAEALRVYPPWLMGYDAPMNPEDAPDPDPTEPEQPPMTELQKQAVELVMQASDDQLLKLIKILEALQ